MQQALEELLWALERYLTSPSNDPSKEWMKPVSRQELKVLYERYNTEKLLYELRQRFEKVEADDN